MASIPHLALDSAAPPADLPRPLRALWWLKKGNLKPGPCWETAHALCQEAEGDLAHDRVHALAHWIEGDAGNAAYWYRRTGTGRAENIAAEWERLVTELSG